VNSEGKELARGIVNYNSQEVARIKRKPSHEIVQILGYVEEAELIHRDNMVLL
jgi:glutamate 5-kinase